MIADDVVLIFQTERVLDFIDIELIVVDEAHLRLDVRQPQIAFGSVRKRTVSAGIGVFGGVIATLPRRAYSRPGPVYSPWWSP